MMTMMMMMMMMCFLCCCCRNVTDGTMQTVPFVQSTCLLARRLLSNGSSDLWRWVVTVIIQGAKLWKALTKIWTLYLLCCIFWTLFSCSALIRSHENACWQAEHSYINMLDIFWCEPILSIFDQNVSKFHSFWYKSFVYKNNYIV